MESDRRPHRAIILLDVDGVLVYDRGYRAAVMATVDHFARQLGLSGMAPTDEEIDALHAAGFTNEWDLNPFVVGILRLAAAKNTPALRPDYPAWARRAEAYSGRPSERALQTLLPELARLSLPGHREAGLRSGLEDLLIDTYSITRCATTQVQQEFVLGSERHATHYGLAPRFSSPSLLLQKDKPALSAEGRACLEQLVAEQGALVCIYTARPSGPPPLAPEAELAVRLVGLERFPLVAMGHMQWLASRHGDTVEALTKPSPVQLLAAVGAAMAGEEEAALEAGYSLVRHGKIQHPLDSLGDLPLVLYVLEDAVPGLQAAAAGLSILQAHGITARLHGIGVSPSQVKAAALAPFCSALVPDVNAGLSWAASSLRQLTAE